MRRIRGVFIEDHSPLEKPATVGQLLIQLFPEEIHVLPLIYDRAQAASCDARLQDLVTTWAAQPERLAALCEIDD